MAAPSCEIYSAANIRIENAIIAKLRIRGKYFSLVIGLDRA